MSDYIKKSDVRKLLLHNDREAALAKLDELESIDAVPVVRCGECKHRDPEDKRCDCGGHEWVKGKILPVKDDWFCASGQRKDGAE